MTNDKRADAQIDVAANNEHADPDGQLSANHQSKYAGEQQRTVAMGSMTLPSHETVLVMRAIWPSIQSVEAATA